MTDTPTKYDTLEAFYQAILAQTPDKASMPCPTDSYWNIEAPQPCDLSSQYAGAPCKS